MRVLITAYAMCHCMTDEEYEMMLKRIREAAKKNLANVEQKAVITVRG